MIERDLLSAYCDGETSPEDTARIEAAMETDPDLVARIEAMMAVRTEIAGAYAGVLDAAPDARTVGLIRDHLSAPASTVVTFRPRAQSPWRQAIWPSAVAAALVAGVFGGVQLDRPALTPGAVDASLASVLDRSPSGEASPVDGGVFKASLSFTARDGSPCRQFTLARDGEVLAGLACKAGRAWRLRASTLEAGQVGGDFQTASGGGEDLVSRMADGLIKGEAFDQAEEQRRIRSGWTQ